MDFSEQVDTRLPPQRPVHSFQSHTHLRVLLYIGSLVRNDLQTSSNCSPRTLGSRSRRANRSLNATTAGMLINGYDDMRLARAAEDGIRQFARN